MDCDGAIHRVRNGRAVGGCRARDFASDDEALTDVLRLSRGMTYKTALAGLPYGGAKAVILGRPTPEGLRAFGRAVDSLGGTYVTAATTSTTVTTVTTVTTITTLLFQCVIAVVASSRSFPQ